MAGEQAAALTEQHRQAQLRVRAGAIRDFMILWPIWTGDWPSFQRLIAATVPLVRAHHATSAAVAAAYYQAFRHAEQIRGAATPTLAPPVDVTAVVKSMYVTGETMTRKAILAGQSPEQARKTALTRVSGAVSRHVLNGGRDTVIGSAVHDRQAIGWARVTDGNPCYFCLTLASRGAVYKTEQTADFPAHDHCGCTVMPVYAGTSLPETTARWKDIYDRAQREGEASGLLQPGENSSDARLNAVRRLLAAEGHGAGT